MGRKLHLSIVSRSRCREASSWVSALSTASSILRAWSQAGADERESGEEGRRGGVEGAMCSLSKNCESRAQGGYKEDRRVPASQNVRASAPSLGGMAGRGRRGAVGKKTPQRSFGGEKALGAKGRGEGGGGGEQPRVVSHHGLLGLSRTALRQEEGLLKGKGLRPLSPGPLPRGLVAATVTPCAIPHPRRVLAGVKGRHVCRRRRCGARDGVSTSPRGQEVTRREGRVASPSGSLAAAT